MRILLCEDIRGLGWLGDVVDVNDGYARNYLLPQGRGKPATKANLRAISKDKVKRAEQRKLEEEQLQRVAEAVEGAEAVVAAKANEQGVLFGSVSASEIAQNLREQGFEVADEDVALHEHIKQVGTAEVTLKFAGDLTATVSVVVVPEGGDVEEIKAAEKAAAEKAAQEEKAAAEKEAEQKEAVQGGENEPDDKDS
ncbi:MAG: 50S ribosomal protein L9 [Planctomycetes bacterium]|nr:50S ribosomal protein L9 [Planctomycetota bacterium]